LVFVQAVCANEGGRICIPGMCGKRDYGRGCFAGDAAAGLNAGFVLLIRRAGLLVGTPTTVAAAATIVARGAIRIVGVAICAAPAARSGAAPASRAGTAPGSARIPVLSHPL